MTALRSRGWLMAMLLAWPAGLAAQAGHNEGIKLVPMLAVHPAGDQHKLMLRIHHDQIGAAASGQHAAFRCGGKGLSL